MVTVSLLPQSNTLYNGYIQYNPKVYKPLLSLVTMKKEKQKEIITIAIWRTDHKKLVDLCKKTDDIRDKFQEILKDHIKNNSKIKTGGRN